MALPSVKKYYSTADALALLKKYCAYQERSHQEVRTRLLRCGLRGNDLENLITKLIDENFLNEERFAIAFAGGKFRLKNWGRKKIEQQLKAKGISTYCIAKAMKEIDTPNYKKTMLILLEKKAAALKDKNIFTRMQKLSNYLIRKGYETELVFQHVNDYYDHE